MEQGTAVQFISVDPDTGKFQVHQEAAEIIENSVHSVAIVSVAGKYRTGKSLLMNLLCGSTDDNFEVSASVNACTRGIWMCSKPITINKDGQEIDVYFMDSEGLGGIDKNQNHDVQIFTLAMLLSSFFIYNSYNVIDENALSALSLVTTLANKIQTLEDEDEAMHLINHFPTFMWLLRDFTLELRDEEGNEVSADQYLEEVLEESYTGHPREEEHNEIRATVKRFFPERYCKTMVRPTDEEIDLQKLKRDLSKIKPEFVEQVDELRDFILNQINVKLIGEIVLTGEDYLSVAVKYVDAINEGAVPRIEDSWAAVVESQLAKGYNRAIEAYQEDIKKFEEESFPCNEEELSVAHNGIMQAAVEIFLEIT